MPYPHNGTTNVSSAPFESDHPSAPNDSYYFHTWNYTHPSVVASLDITFSQVETQGGNIWVYVGGTEYAAWNFTSLTNIVVTVPSSSFTVYLESGNGAPPTYGFRVSSVVESGGGGGPTPPAAPVLSGSPGWQENTLSWSAVTDATSYDLYRADGAGAFALRFGGIGALSFTDQSLTNGTTYHYRLRANGTGGTSSDSNTVSLTPLGGATTTGNVTWVPGPITPAAGIAILSNTVPRLPAFDMRVIFRVGPHAMKLEAMQANMAEYVEVSMGGRYDGDTGVGWGTSIELSPWGGQVIVNGMSLNTPLPGFQTYVDTSINEDVYLPETNYSVRLRIEVINCSQIQTKAKFWKSSDAEPGLWHYDMTRSSVPTNDSPYTDYGLFVAGHHRLDQDGNPITYTFESVSVIDLAGDPSTGCVYVVPGVLPPPTVLWLPILK